LKARIWLITFSVVFAFVGVGVGAAAAARKILLAPKFFAGQSLRYRIQTRTSTKGTTTTPIKNPEGGSETNLATRLVVRLDVLRVGGPADTASAATATPVEIAANDARVRATYEEALASTESDAVNPGAPSPSALYKRIEGHSIEFTIGPGGTLADFQGLDEIFANRSDAEPMLSWARGLSSSAGFPKHGIEVGQKWTNERQLDGMPLTGLIWRTEATYLRDEPCNSSASDGENAAAPAGHAAAGAQNEMCAVILTQFQIERHASARADATPEDYRKSGLRTSGKWSGSGESMESISLATGMLVSSTQTSEQDVDYEIVSTNTGSAIHRTGHVTTKTEITLLPAIAAPKS
jgi:hypothetical protein